MRFMLTPEHQAFARSLDALLTSADTVAVARAWADGNTGPGLALWDRLAEQAVHALLVPEDLDGAGATPVELVVAFEALGRHAVPGPWVESVAFLPVALGTDPVVTALAEGAVGTVAVPPTVPRALDADVAAHVYLASGSALAAASVGQLSASVDGTRRLFSVTASNAPALEPPPQGALDAAFDTAVLASAAQLLGCGERLLADSLAYVKQRRQFGREIGSYQAIKHQLADVHIALEFARPLVLGAALSVTARDVSAAKVAAGDAAYLAARTALQVHGAVGYTRELDLSLWITKVRALVGAWGTNDFHRGRVLDALTRSAR